MISKEERARRRAQVKAEDAQLLPSTYAIRPLIGREGILLGIQPDDGSRPISTDWENFALNKDQALQLAKDLVFMIRINEQELEADGNG